MMMETAIVALNRSWTPRSFAVHVHFASKDIMMRQFFTNPVESFRALVLALGVALALFSAPPASAKDHDKAREAVSSGQAQPLDAILPKVRARYPGQLLDAKLKKSGGKYRYIIKILDKNGKVRRVTVDARSGRILK